MLISCCRFFPTKFFTVVNIPLIFFLVAFQMYDCSCVLVACSLQIREPRRGNELKDNKHTAHKQERNVGCCRCCNSVLKMGLPELWTLKKKKSSSDFWHKFCVKTRLSFLHGIGIETSGSSIMSETARKYQQRRLSMKDRSNDEEEKTIDLDAKDFGRTADEIIDAAGWGWFQVYAIRNLIIS